MPGEYDRIGKFCEYLEAESVKVSVFQIKFDIFIL
jgi:hypothetical protein